MVEFHNSLNEVAMSSCVRSKQWMIKSQNADFTENTVLQQSWVCVYIYIH